MVRVPMISGLLWSALVVDNVDMILQEIVNQNNINQPEQGESREDET